MTKTVVVLAWLAISCGLEIGTRGQPAVETEPELPVAVRDAVGEDGTADLKDQLESELRARRPEEFAFIERVITLMEAGTLSRDMVEGTFFWARERQPRPFQYFERAMRIRAAEIGVTL